jgi:glucose-1-phosphate adenylyltransferase
MRILALVLAGGEGSRLRPFTENHAKPALLFVNGYRIVDFVLSSLINSGITSIYVLAQYKPQSLIEHIQSVWAPAQAGPDHFVKVVQPEAGLGRGPFLGTADAVYKNLHLCSSHAPELVAVFAADHVYRMDVRQMVEMHVQSEAEVSVAALPIPIERASHFGIIATHYDGRIREFQEKPERPAPILGWPSHAYASMGNYLFNPNVLMALLEEAASRGETDFGRDVLPRAIATHRVFAYDFAGNRVPGILPHEESNYWRDVGTIEGASPCKRIFH